MVSKICTSYVNSQLCSKQLPKSSRTLGQVCHPNGARRPSLKYQVNTLKNLDFLLIFIKKQGLSENRIYFKAYRHKELIYNKIYHMLNYL